ncbi:MAG: Wzz/FepE/Etk N-terminal domain-containing protein [Thermodesulfobacteriota bacterium]
MAEEDRTKEIVYVPASSIPQMQEEEDEIDLLELWRIITSGKWFILCFTFLCTLAAVIVSLKFLPVVYKSDAVLQPTSTEGKSMGGLEGLADSLPIDISSGGGGKEQKIMDFLNSRNLKMDLIQNYDLLPRLYEDMWNKEKSKWEVPSGAKKPTVIRAIQNEKLSMYKAEESEEEGLMTISWTSEDPEFAAKMVERIIDEARHYLEEEYETDAERKLKFVKKQLKQAEEELNHWENQVPTDDLARAKIERERSAAQQVYTELRKQLETAKISAEKEVIKFKVLDPPFVPEEKYKPKRGLICALTLVASLFIAVFLVFFRHFLINVRKSEMK